MNKYSTHTHSHSQIFPLFRNFALLATILLTASCKEVPKEVEITHQRELCKFDENEALRRSVNRFKAMQPLHWRRVAATQNRILNYRVGEQTEVALGVFTGSVESNVIRWHGQYGEKMDTFDTSQLQQGTMLNGVKYYVVDIKGKFETSMGGMAVKQDNWSTLGIICQFSKQDLITIKMTGPVSETTKEMKSLIKFTEDLKYITYPEDNQ